MAKTLLAVKNLSVNYGAINALRTISFEVTESEIITLVGSNGAGKSTSLNAISNIVKKASGSILYNGLDISNMPPDKIVSLGLVQVPEGRRIFANLNVKDNLEMGAYSRKGANIKQELRSDMEKVFALFPRLKERVRQMAGTLSGGEQQMLAIGRALMAHPKLLLLD